jgi:hypothetical protein
MRHFRIRTASLSAFIAVALIAGCKHSTETTAPAQAEPATAATGSDSAALASAVDAFIEGAFERNPVFAANAGKHEFDGKLPDYSPAALKADADWLHAQRDRFAAMTDDRLDEKGRFQRDYVLAIIDGQLFWLEDSGFAYSNPAFYTGDLSPSMYLTRPYAPLPQRMAAFVTYQEALPRALEQIKANLNTRKRCPGRSSRSRPISSCRCRRPTSTWASIHSAVTQVSSRTMCLASSPGSRTTHCRRASRRAMPQRSRRPRRWPTG